MRALAFLVLLIAICLPAGEAMVSGAQAQDQPKEGKTPRLIPMMQQAADPHSLFELRRRLLELDKLLSLGSVARAKGLIEELAQHSGLERDLVTRRILLAQLQDDHPEAIELAREALRTRPTDPGLWRSLANSLLAASRPDSARLALDRFIAHHPNRRSASVVAVDQCLGAGRPEMAVALIDSLRPILQEATFLSRQRAVGLLQLDRQEEAADQVSAELRSNPYNLSLLRTELLDGVYDRTRHTEFFAELEAMARHGDAAPVELVLVANLMLAAGDAGSAWRLVGPLTVAETSTLILFQNVATLNSELDLLDDDRRFQATVDYLLLVLENLMGPDQKDALLRRRAADQLAEVCERALMTGNLGDEPEAAAERFADLLLMVRAVNPSSERLYSAQIHLAEFTRRELGDPASAARRLEHLLMDLDLPIEGVALTRLTLGECYLASGDTTRGRAVLTQLGRDPEFRQSGGYAHYHLARLDLAQGHLVTARDRFAVVAMDNPSASYANEALELGLAIAEELDNPSGGPEILGFYAKTVMSELLDRPRERIAALETFVAEATLRLDPEEPQHLLERGLYELAQALIDADRIEEALSPLRTIYLEHPDGRYPAQALALEGHLLRESGRDSESVQALNRLLAQYPDYLFIDDVRDQLRELP